ncbi:polyamine-transporting ATPase 13A2-like [Dermacentor variabilis]|uniref:polyamine-transporting ATPase 13A2-like n=1 Tax=Dermacentor variabilis TaxID=34621 RepID=UPI003F5AF366
MLGGEDGTEEEGALRGWQPSGGYEPLRWLLPKGWVLRLAAWRCPLARASLVSVHDGAGRLLAVRRVAPDGTFRHRGVRFCWDGATFRIPWLLQEERGLDDGQLTCGQLLASAGVHSDRRSALLQQHGPNEYTSVARRSRIPGTQWLAIGSFLWLLRSHYLTAGIAAFVVTALWLSQTCECLIGRFRSRRVVHSPTTLALPNAEEVESSLLVPGDVIALKQGDRAPCDMVLLSGDCVVDQGDVALPRMAARWPLTAPEGELFSVHKHRTSVILRPSRIACSRGQLLAVVLRTGAATESALLCSSPEWLYVEDEEGLGPAQWAVAAAAFLLSLLFWLGRDRFTWDEVLLRALSLHLLLFPPRALLANWLLEKVAVSALASARATSSRSALSSVARWGRTSRVAIDSAGALCEAAEKLAGVLPAGCHGFAPVIARGLSQLPRGHPLRWAAAAVGAALWKEGSDATGHPHEVATFAAAGSGLKADGDGYGLDTPPESPGPPLRLAPFVNPFWSTQRLDEDLRETRDPPDVISSVVVEVSRSCEPPWTNDCCEGSKGDYQPRAPSVRTVRSQRTSVGERPPSAEIPQIRVHAPPSRFSPYPALLAGARAIRRLSGQVANSCPLCHKKRPPAPEPEASKPVTPELPEPASTCRNDMKPVIEEHQAQDLLRERSECRRLCVLECEPRRAGRDWTTIVYETRNHREIVCVGRPGDVFPLCQGDHPAPCNAKAVSASFHERGFGIAAIAGRSCLDEGSRTDTARDCDLNFEGLLFFEPVMNPQAAPAVEELRRIDLRPVVVDEANVYRCIAVARSTGVVLPDEPLMLVATRKTVFGGPAVDIRILTTPSLFELPKQKVTAVPSRLHYALSYRTLVVLRKHFPGLLSSVRDSVSVLGGLPANRAAAAMRQLGIQTVCAGATLGLAASQRGAIVVGGRAQWPPLACDSVADVPRVALAARCVLGCRGATLDYVALSVCLQACALLVLYAQRATFTDRMHVYLELVACGGPTAALAVSRQGAPPPPRQDAAAFVLHALCWLAAQVALLGQLHCRGWYARLPERLQRRLDASVVCLLASYQLPLLAVQLAAFRGGSGLRPVAVACVLPIAATTALMFPWAASASLALGLPRWPRDRETLLLRMGIVLAALLNLLVDTLVQLFVAPKFRSDAQPADTMRVPVAETHIGRGVPPGTGARQ